MSALSDERVTLEVTGEAVFVQIMLGEVRIGVALPLPTGASEMSAAQFRSSVLNSARRALDVARQELA